MAPTPLQQLAEHDQSVWSDFLSRKFVKEGGLKALVDRGVVGVTSNPTIFQAAIADGDAYDDQIRELSTEHDDAKEIFWLLAKDDIRDACDVLRPIWDEGHGKDGWVSLEVDPNLAHDTEATKSEARAPARAGRPPEPLHQDPGDPGGPAGDRGLDRGRHPDQRHADLLPRALPQGRRGLRPRPQALRRRRRRPERQARLGRLVLRLARRHRGRQAPGPDRRPRRAQGHAGDRQRQARLPGLRGDLLRPRVGGAGGQGRDQAALPVGVDLDQEPGLPRRPVRRGARRPGHGQHDAARARSTPPRTTARSAATRSRRTSRAPARRSTRSRPPASATTTSSQVLEREGVEKFAKSFEDLIEGLESKLKLVAA